MAEIIPPLNRQTLGRMTSGEKRVARRLQALLENDYLVWFDIPVGKKRRYPDFIILHPSRGLLFLEVKDWKPDTLKKISKSDVTLLTDTGLVTRPHPLEQARQYTYNVIGVLSRDPKLCQATGAYKGNLAMPYGWGVVFTNITRKQIEKAISHEQREGLLPDHLTIYKDEITENTDAQSIYHKKSGLGFSLSSVGIQGKGRTTILRLNYRNTREILHFAYTFARHYLYPKSADDDHIPLIEPEAAGNSGPAPVVRQNNSLQEEIAYALKCLTKWRQQGIPWGDMAVVYAEGSQGHKMASQLRAAGIPHTWLASKQYKSTYNPGNEQVTVLTIHSSKGLEFPRVIMLGIGQLNDSEARQAKNARLLYVGMTRAQECLLITTSAKNAFSRKLLEVAQSV